MAKPLPNRVTGVPPPIANDDAAANVAIGITEPTVISEPTTTGYDTTTTLLTDAPTTDTESRAANDSALATTYTGTTSTLLSTVTDISQRHRRRQRNRSPPSEVSIRRRLRRQKSRSAKKRKRNASGSTTSGLSTTDVTQTGSSYTSSSSVSTSSTESPNDEEAFREANDAAGAEQQQPMPEPVPVSPAFITRKRAKVVGKEQLVLAIQQRLYQVEEIQNTLASQRMLINEREFEQNVQRKRIIEQQAEIRYLKRQRQHILEDVDRIRLQVRRLRTTNRRRRKKIAQLGIAAASVADMSDMQAEEGEKNDDYDFEGKVKINWRPLVELNEQTIDYFAEMYVNDFILPRVVRAFKKDRLRIALADMRAKKEELRAKQDTLERMESLIQNRQDELLSMSEAAVQLKAFIVQRGYLRWEEKFGSLRSLIFRLDAARYDVENLTAEFEHLRMTNTARLQTLRAQQQLSLAHMSKRVNTLLEALAEALSPRVPLGRFLQQVCETVQWKKSEVQQTFYVQQAQACELRSIAQTYEGASALIELNLNSTSFVIKLLEAYKRLTYTMMKREQYLDLAAALKMLDVGEEGLDEDDVLVTSSSSSSEEGDAEKQESGVKGKIAAVVEGGVGIAEAAAESVIRGVKNLEKFASEKLFGKK